MKNFCCSHCGHVVEAVIPPTRCPLCNTIMVSTEEAAEVDDYHLPPMRFVKKATISDFWYCKRCQMYRKNAGFSETTPCPECSSIQYNDNRETFVVTVESYLEDALRNAESASPDINEIRKNLRICYGWYEWFYRIENVQDNEEWINQIIHLEKE